MSSGLTTVLATASEPGSGFGARDAVGFCTVTVLLVDGIDDGCGVARGVVFGFADGGMGVGVGVNDGVGDRDRGRGRALDW